MAPRPPIHCNLHIIWLVGDLESVFLGMGQTDEGDRMRLTLKGVVDHPDHPDTPNQTQVQYIFIDVCKHCLTNTQIVYCKLSYHLLSALLLVCTSFS